MSEDCGCVMLLLDARELQFHMPSLYVLNCALSKIKQISLTKVAVFRAAVTAAKL